LNTSAWVIMQGSQLGEANHAGKHPCCVLPVPWQGTHAPSAGFGHIQLCLSHVAGPLQTLCFVVVVYIVIHRPT
jgi:hypothetical protein